MIIGTTSDKNILRENDLEACFNQSKRVDNLFEKDEICAVLKNFCDNQDVIN